MVEEGKFKKILFFIFYEILVLLIFAAAFGFSLYKIFKHFGFIKVG